MKRKQPYIWTVEIQNLRTKEWIPVIGISTFLTKKTAQNWCRVGVMLNPRAHYRPAKYVRQP